MLIDIFLKDNIKVTVKQFNALDAKIASVEAKKFSVIASQEADRATVAADRAELIEQDVINEGNTQVARVISEGDIQEARVILAGDDAYVESRQAEAEQMTADSYANEPIDTFVKDYYYDEQSDSILFTETGFYSAFHWSEKAKLAAGGLEYIGNWDASSGTYPPDGTVTGQFYIVSVGGDISGETFNVGDWIIWDNDAAVWNGVHWLFSWAIAKDVTVEGAAPAVGDDLARNGTSYTKTETDGLLADKADITYVDTELDSHTSDTNNPHSVTAAQVGAPDGSWAWDDATATLEITIP